MKMKGKKPKYDENSIQVLTGLSGVRKNPTLRESYDRETEVQIL